MSLDPEASDAGLTAGRIAVTGAAGQLGRQVVRVFEEAGWRTLGLSHGRLDITDPRSLSELRDWGPDLVVNCAAWTDVDGCARDPERAMAINGTAAGTLAKAAASGGALMVQISTNEVFDGSADDPYTEDDEPGPVNPYGASKLLGERLVALSAPRHLIVRTAWIFGPGGRNFPAKMIEVVSRQAAAGEAVRVVADEHGNPTWAPDLAQGILMAIGADQAGYLSGSILHIAGAPPASRYEWARAILADTPGLQLVPISLAEYQRPSRVPPRAVLATERASALGIPPSDWRSATARYVRDVLAASPT